MREGAVIKPLVFLHDMLFNILFLPFTKVDLQNYNCFEHEIKANCWDMSEGVVIEPFFLTRCAFYHTFLSFTKVNLQNCNTCEHVKKGSCWDNRERGVIEPFYSY